MHISRITISNFRNFSSLDIKLQAGVTCLVGENNSGKSNLLHALRIVVDHNLPNRLRELRPQDIHCCPDVSEPQHVLIAVEISGIQASDNTEALFGRYQCEDGVARLIYRFRPTDHVREQMASDEGLGRELTIDDYSYEIMGGGKPDEKLLAANWDTTLPGASRVYFGQLSHFNVESLGALRDVEDILARSSSSPLARILESIGLTSDEKEKLVSILNEANKKVADHSAIKSIGESASKSFKHVAGDINELDIQVGLIDPSYSSIARSLRVLLSDAKISNFEPSRNGLGINNLLYIALLVDYFDRRSTSKEAAGDLLLIEEPEAHLHPQLQRVLYEALRGKGVQAILTTHSTHITSAAPLESFVSLTCEGASTSAVQLVASSGLSLDEVADLDRYLDATRSSLLFARRVILVEGPAELFVIPPLVKAVLGIDLSRSGVEVVPIFGRHFSSYTKIFGNNSLRKRCAVIGDCDIAFDPAWLNGDEEKVWNVDDSLSSDFVQTFGCRTTFERLLVCPGLIDVIIATLKGMRRPKDVAAFGVIVASPTETLPTKHAHLRERFLRIANDVGKARFAQLLSKHAHLAKGVPAYIKDAVEWVVSDD